MTRAVPAGDFAARLQACLPRLGVCVVSHQALVDAVREANASREPRQVATWLVRQASEWLPAPCWVVISHDVDGKTVVLAESGLTPTLEPSLWAVANWMLQRGGEFASGDLAADVRTGAQYAGSALAFPLFSRAQMVGVLIGLDPLPSASAPSLGPQVAPGWRVWLESPAIALDNALALQKAQALSLTDDLTKLYNSRYLHLVLRKEAKRALRFARPLSLLFLDLDGFKQVNDSFGHLAGSKALVQAAAVIRSCARETDVVARYGGDEFSLILPETGRDGAVAVAERIAERLRAFDFLAGDGLAVKLTASIGVATLPDSARSAEELIQAADTAMYQVKARGKNGIYVAQE